MRSAISICALALLSCASASTHGALRSESLVSVYGQCGGRGYAGATTCTSGNTCVYIASTYSQCLPTPPTSTEFATYAQCDGSNFKTNGKTCRPNDMCYKLTSLLSRCYPKKSE
ncbi:hypothetical protein SPRG_13799 [Saprolegnia parasitica CBS 223.65]|uniref:CBM1 domain-containing protein n=1 Tax=Saprolegnia parasitica (strain CBS 223.65) TaxID=695850 RepID=A0A067C3G3_SAPPC|nr:hypothetical protein SPRG_13799 [Saprolegnia parasitica CBS 223.65]KDO21091.1 hypothetical protein SPRG_13799 [Saprolegnia parasitica CBS 223.65]|eukprot:XP_012208186.1 hypothetical protein SPRG_13799 [Saprolegnia parasitica CBS 223.65]